jgi:hypothetical protein
MKMKRVRRELSGQPLVRIKALYTIFTKYSCIFRKRIQEDTESMVVSKTK